MNGEITNEIKRFIQDHINSIEQLEILLLLASNPNQEWSALETSLKLYRRQDSVAACLEELRCQNLVTMREEAVALYRYAHEARRNVLVQGVGRAYDVRKDAVIRLVFTRPHGDIRTV